MQYPVSGRFSIITEPYTAEVRQRSIRPLAPEEVLIRIRSSALCGSDLHTVRGRHPSVPLPATIGHEFSGDVIALGDAAPRHLLGKRVTAEPCRSCGQCPACLRGEYQLCKSLQFIYRSGDGALADYIVVRSSSVLVLPDALSYDVGALIEPLSVAVHTVRRADVQLGDTVLILGDGPIGLLTAAVCRRSGATRILLAGHSDARLALALQFGATDTLNTHGHDPAAWALELTEQFGVDKGFECVGSETCLTQAISALRRGGVLTISGICEQPRITWDISQLVSRELTIQGAQGYCRDFPAALSLAAELPMEQLVTHSFSLDQLPQALETALDRTSGSLKIMLHP